jgi:hypothetical protein
VTVSFTMLGAAAAPPVLRFSLDALAERPVLGMVVRAQVMIEPAQRSYDDAERAALQELFGVPERWGATTQPFLLAHGEATVPGFEVSSPFTLDLPFPATDEVAPVRYLRALAGGDVPLALHFTGRVHHADGVVHISWDESARLRVPLAELAELLGAARPSVPDFDQTMAELSRAR